MKTDDETQRIKDELKAVKARVISGVEVGEYLKLSDRETELEIMLVRRNMKLDDLSREELIMKLAEAEYYLDQP